MSDLRETLKFIPLAVPYFFGKNLEHLEEAVTRNQIAIGPHVELLEEKIKQFTGAQFAVAVNSGTAALQIAVMSSKVASGECILVPSFTFAATANAIISSGRIPFFCDISLNDLCIDIFQIKTFLATECERKSGKLVHLSSGLVIGGIMAVHMYGNPCDLDALKTVCDEYELELIEDGTEALGASWKNYNCGSNSRFFAISFNGNKLITSGGGGMLLTNEKSIEKQARIIANQGKGSVDPESVDLIGHNFRMPNLNAAIACDQAMFLDEYLQKKVNINNFYKSHLRGLALGEIVSCSDCGISSYWLSIFRLDLSDRSFTLMDLMKTLSDKGIETRRVWKPLHLMKAYANFPKITLQNSMSCYETDFCLPSSVGNTEADLQYVCKTLTGILA